MATFQEKLVHACRVFSVSIADVCNATGVKPFSLYLQITGQRQLSHNEMLQLCQFFDVVDDYFTNEAIQYVDEDELPGILRELMSKPQKNKKILCYEEVTEEEADFYERIFEDIRFSSSRKDKVPVAILSKKFQKDF
ncbi:hypothetical protein P22_1737 [Propionispora sp. 2/2-37]|uniref:hypothetical protein n=1 Tax=Propionispora sp. 2/2-37 TaxID=1677858 RepID=UPI0006BB777B|nr:hypothetical protein [Propionispora sp. 2/2-37]CUH95662.1 hypothetical protein P22_1737 [Propionispora sp. 2/2-37]